MRRLVALWRSDPLRWTLAAVAAGTAVSGFAQLVAPGFVLRILSGPETTATKIFFAIIGMFMFVVGGALAHALLEPYDRRVTLFWASLQKLGAACAVTLCVVKDVFSGYALILSAFDLTTGIVGMTYLVRSTRRRA